MRERQLSYWQKPDRKAIFVTDGIICYQPDYLTEEGLNRWYSQVNALFVEGVIQPVRWYHRLWKWFWDIQ